MRKFVRKPALLMVPKHLCGTSGSRIPVRVASSSGKTLLECSEPGHFLGELGKGPFEGCLGPETMLRGVFVPGEGAWFQVFDSFGALSREEIHLDEQAALVLLQRIV